MNNQLPAIFSQKSNGALRPGAVYSIPGYPAFSFTAPAFRPRPYYAGPIFNGGRAAPRW